MKQKKTLNLPNSFKNNWNIICDFDGTITPFDVTDAVLEKFADKQWEQVEQEWLAGNITARQCMAKQISLLNVSPKNLNAFLDEIPITPGFKEFLHFCHLQSLNVLVVSDGMDYVIKRILKRHGLARIPVVANRLILQGNANYKLDFPYGKEGCKSGVCKCNVAESKGGKVLLIGDSHSDCCLANIASLVMAKRGKALQSHCELNGYSHLVYDDFFDVYSVLAKMLQAEQTEEKFATDNWGTELSDLPFAQGT